MRALIAFGRTCKIIGVFFLLTSSVPHIYAQPSFSITDARGSRTLETRPSKVVVLDFATLDTLNALGVSVAGVPFSPILPPRLQGYSKSVRVVGSAFEPNYEVINAIKPDLVIVSDRSAPKYEQLSRIAPTIDLTPDPKKLIESLDRNTLLLSRLFGKQAEAHQKLNALHKAISTLRSKASRQGTGLIVMTTGGKLSAFGPGSRFGVLHDAFGIRPADGKLTISSHGQAISYEYLLRTDPDWLFVIDRDAAIGREGLSAQRLLDNAVVHRTKAWKKGHVIYLNTANWYLLDSVGLTAAQENVEDLIQVFEKHEK